MIAQNSPVTFEDGGIGSLWTWTVFENDMQPPLEIVSNPNPTGLNLSNKVAKFTAMQNGMPWAGCETQHGSDIGTFTLNATNCIVKMMVYKPIISNVGIKYATASGASTYVWSTTATTASINANAAGTYSVIGTASNGCTGSASIAVSENP